VFVTLRRLERGWRGSASGGSGGRSREAAVVLASVERTPLNDYTTWHALEGRLLELFGREAPIAVTANIAVPMPAAHPAAAAQNQNELAQ